MSFLEEQHRIISEVEKKKNKGQIIQFLTGTAIGGCDNYFYDFYYGNRNLLDTLLIYYLKEKDRDNNGFDYIVHIVNSSTAEPKCYARDSYEPLGYKRLNSVNDLLDEGKLDSVFGDNDDFNSLDSDATSDEVNRAKDDAAQMANQTSQILERLGATIEKGEKRILILLEGMEWICNLHSHGQEDTTWIANLQKPSWVKANNLLVIATIRDMELLKQYNFEEEETFVGAPSAEEICWSYLRYIVRNTRQRYEFEYKVLDDIANIMHIGKKTLVQCMRILKQILQEYPEKLDKDNFLKAAEQNIEEEVHWSDVILQSEVKRQLMEAVDSFLSDDDKAAKKKGFILAGPPGTGKTMIAKALANEKHCYFMAPTLADMKGEYIGHSSAKVKRIFEEARGQQPTILFIDEADTIFPDRDGTVGGEGDVFARDMVNQFLVEVDGAKTGKQKIFIIAATNRIQVVDSAVRSRLNKDPIFIPLPDAGNRLALFNSYLHPFTLNGKSFQNDVIRRSENMSGRDIKNFTDSIKVMCKNDLSCLGDNLLTRNIFQSLFDGIEGSFVDECIRKGIFTAGNILTPRNNAMKLDDIIGYTEQKREIKKQVDYIIASANRKKEYEKFGVKPGKGVVLYGPPGNGKSELAQAIAGEYGFYFFKILSQDFASALPERQLDKLDKIFHEVQKFSKIMHAPGIVLFFDEFDSLVGKDVLNTVVRGTLLNYLADKSGLRSDESKILLIAATNFFSKLDDAVKRKGRLDAHLLLNNPTAENGKKMLKNFFETDDAVFSPVDESVVGIAYEALVTEMHNNPAIVQQIMFDPEVNVLRTWKGDEIIMNEKLKETRPSGADIRILSQDLKERAFLKGDHFKEGKLDITLDLVAERFVNLKKPSDKMI